MAASLLRKGDLPGTIPRRERVHVQLHVVGGAADGDDVGVAVAGEIGSDEILDRHAAGIDHLAAPAGAVGIRPVDGERRPVPLDG